MFFEFTDRRRLTDTKIYGQLAGAYYGASAIPEAWRSVLAHRALIESLALDLHKLAGRQTAQTM